MVYLDCYRTMEKDAVQNGCTLVAEGISCSHADRRDEKSGSMVLYMVKERPKHIGRKR